MRKSRFIDNSFPPWQRYTQVCYSHFFSFSLSLPFYFFLALSFFSTRWSRIKLCEMHSYSMHHIFRKIRSEPPPAPRRWKLHIYGYSINQDLKSLSNNKRDALWIFTGQKLHGRDIVSRFPRKFRGANVINLARSAKQSRRYTIAAGHNESTWISKNYRTENRNQNRTKGRQMRIKRDKLKLIMARNCTRLSNLMQHLKFFIEPRTDRQELLFLLSPPRPDTSVCSRAIPRCNQI